MVRLRRKFERVQLKQVSLYGKERDIIDDKLKCYGDFSGFVRFCLYKQDLIEEYLKTRPNV